MTAESREKFILSELSRSFGPSRARELLQSVRFCTINIYIYIHKLTRFILKLFIQLKVRTDEVKRQLMSEQIVVPNVSLMFCFIDSIKLVADLILLSNYLDWNLATEYTTTSTSSLVTTTTATATATNESK